VNTSDLFPNRRVPVALKSVEISDAFWAPLREQVREQTLPQQWAQMKRPGQQLDALRLQWKPGHPHEPHIFWESDVAKWIEAASYVLGRACDEALERDVDEAIELLAGAQQPDGYLNVYFTVVKPELRFTDLRDAHELYCLGHLVEAAVAHVEATGKATLLAIVERYVDLVAKLFGEGGELAGGYCGHEEIELALVKLHRLTRDRRYLDLALDFVRNRGRQPFYFEDEMRHRGTPGYFGTTLPQDERGLRRFREYNQSHLPVVEQTDAVGHSVRAMYLYAAMVDLATETSDEAMLAACKRLWESVSRRRMYVTAAIGTDRSIEGFGADYALPSEHGYGETCASIGLMMWAQRLANAEADGRYLDVLEVALYNAVLAGTSLDGTKYFYDNPLASDGSVHRQDWFACACCPPNLARTLSSLEGYAYSQGEQEAALNLYLTSRATFAFGGGSLVLAQTSDYLGRGTVDVMVEQSPDGPITLALRIPGWAGEPVLTVNGSVVPVEVERGFARLRRTWRAGDTVGLRLRVEPALVRADVAVADAAGKVAIMRGPVVYCVEGIDNEVPVHQLRLDPAGELTTGDDTWAGLPVVRATGMAERNPEHADELYRRSSPAADPTTITAIPYFGWDNRGSSTMAVWLRADG